MNMINTPKIALRIHGNPKSNAGYEPILTLNAMFPQLKDGDYPGMQSNPYYYVIHIGSNYTQYTLVHNGVSSYGANRQGTLKMAMGLPKGYCIKNRISPLDLLSQMRDIFVATCLTQVGPSSYQFKPDINSEELTCGLNEMLELYPLEPTAKPHRPMSENIESGTGIIIIPNEKIEQLFRDVQYKEFSQYHEIVVAEQGSVLSSYARNLSELPIPRMSNYQLVVNGIRQPMPTSDSVVVTAYKTLRKNPDYYEDEQIEFKISEIISGKQIKHVALDLDQERILCTLTPNPKQKQVEVIVDCPGGQCDYTKIKISFGGLEFAVTKGNNLLTFKGDDIAKIDGPVTCDYFSNDYYVENRNTKVTRASDGSQKLYIKLTKSARSLQPLNGGIEPILVLAFPYGSLGEKYHGNYNFTVKVENDCGATLEDSVVFEEKKNKNGVKFLQGEIGLPVKWRTIYCISIPKLGIRREGSIRIKDNKCSCIDANWEKTKSHKLNSRVLLGGLMLISLAIGVVVGHYIWHPNNPSDSKDLNSTKKDVRIDANNERKREKIKDNTEWLKSDTVTFASIRYLMEYYKYFQYSNESPDEVFFKELLADYSKIVDYIEKGDVDGIKQFACSISKNKLTMGQNNYLKCIYEGYNDHKYSDQEEKKAIGNFKEQHDNIESFEQLQKIYNYAISNSSSGSSTHGTPTVKKEGRKRENPMPLSSSENS